jgi:Co/Zn/Cd efflux system component
MTLSLMTLGIMTLKHDCKMSTGYGKCRTLAIVLNVIIQNVVMLSATAPLLLRLFNKKYIDTKIDKISYKT